MLRLIITMSVLVGCQHGRTYTKSECFDEGVTSVTITNEGPAWRITVREKEGREYDSYLKELNPRCEYEK